jgi:Ni2+-binding GTPase involved in maturation of urease and hydrogenase
LSKARYIMIGGFLGAGKSTSVLRFAERLSAAGKQVGLITNDQGAGLVDTTLMRAGGFPVEEIAGGCFCCRFGSLKDAADRLSADTRPDVFLAEPVGSCTDLVATVSYPLRRLYGDDFDIAPLSVLVDPIRALRVLELEPGARRLSSKVCYVYRKQLEEADIIVINKIDLLTPQQLELLRAGLAAEYPQARIFACEVRNNAGVDPWYEEVVSGTGRWGEAMSIDYQTYGEGEALLGWLNATLQLDAESGTDGNSLLAEFASAIQQRLIEADGEVAHLKMTLSPGDGSGELAVVNLVRNDAQPEATHTLLDPVDRGELIVNLRAEAAPDILEAAFQGALGDCARGGSGVQFHLDHLEHFRPGAPVPVYRDATAPQSGA